MIRDAIKREIAEQGISQQKLADAIGIKKSAMSLYLSGKSKISIDTIEEILRYLSLAIIKKEQP